MSMPSTWHACRRLLFRDLKLAYRHRSDLANPLLFFLIIVSLFPLAIGPDQATLGRLAPGILWVGALLATLLSLDSLFRSDFEDGALEQIMLSPYPASLLIGARILAHWLVTGLLLLLISPALALMLYLPGKALPTLVWTLALGTPTLSLVGAIGIALTVGLRRGGLLLSLLVLPLYIPVLIVATSAVSGAAAGDPVSGQLYFLAALLVLSLTLAPLAVSAALRISLR